MIQINVVMVALTISMHFQQFEDLKFRIFSGVAYTRTKLGGIVPILLENPESCPDFEDQLSRANGQRNIVLLNFICHNISHKMNKPFNLGCVRLTLFRNRNIHNTNFVQSYY